MYDIKSTQAQIKGVDTKKRVVEGYFSTFNVKDSDGDIIRPGAFAKTVRENGPEGKNRIMHLLQHNPLQPLGKPAELKEDDNGLFFVTKISDTSFGTDTLKLYADRVLEEHSIGFNIIDSNYSDGEGANIITEIKLWEGSTVTWGANEHARVKSLDKKELIKKYDALSKAFYKGDYTDDTFRLIEAQRKHIELLLAEPEVTTAKPEPTTCEKLDSVFSQFNRNTKLEGIFNGRR